MQIHGNLALGAPPTVRLFGFDFRRAIPGRKGEKGAGEIADAIVRNANGQGIWTKYYGGIIARTVAPQFYEVLRESIPILDGAIDRLITIDGVPIIEGEDAALVAEASEWARTVAVNDNQTGLAAFAFGLRNETHEQGFGIGEFVPSDSGDDIVRLNVADSKAIHFARTPEGPLRWYYNPTTRRLSIASALTAAEEIFSGRASANTVTAAMSGLGYTELTQANKVYIAYFTENAEPYGVSRFRSLELVAKTLLTIENGLLNSWERFGDPSFHIHHKSTKKLADGVADSRRAAIATDFKTALQGKREGKAMDFVTVADQDGDITVSIIGAGNDVLECEMPARHVLEQIVAKLGLAAWTLGLHFSTAERLAKFQSELMKQESDTRTDIEEQTLDTIVAAMLRARGRTWSNEVVPSEDGKTMVRKAWRIAYRKPNLADQESLARANFMNAQAEAVRAGGDGTNAVGASVSLEEGKAVIGFPPMKSVAGGRHLHAVKALETRPIESPALDKIEGDALSAISDEWTETTLYIIRALGLESADSQNSMTTEGFAFTQADKDMLAAELEGFVSGMYENTATSQGAMAKAFDRAWAQGVIEAYMRSGLDGPVGELNNTAAVVALFGPSSDHFQTFIDNKLTGRIHRVLQAGVEAGENPLNIAANLKREMGGASWKWEQIARSETAMAWDDAKRAEWGAEIESGDIDDKFDFIPAPDACPVCQGMATGNSRPLRDTPKPVFDTHPSCRCDIAPALPESQS